MSEMTFHEAADVLLSAQRTFRALALIGEAVDKARDAEAALAAAGQAKQNIEADMAALQDKITAAQATHRQVLAQADSDRQRVADEAKAALQQTEAKQQAALLRLQELQRDVTNAQARTARSIDDFGRAVEQAREEHALKVAALRTELEDVQGQLATAKTQLREFHEALAPIARR